MGTFVYLRPLVSPITLFQNGYWSGYSERPMAKEKLLTEANCKAAKASTKMYYLNDGGGLRLRVQTNGSRNWLFRYKLGGKEKTAGLGAYPQVSLQEARKRALAAKGSVSEGQDPVVMKRMAKMKQVVASQQSFGSVARAWLAHNKESWSHHHYERNEGLIRRYLLPSLSALPLDSIEGAFLFDVLKKVYDSGIKESARRTRGLCGQIFDHGKALHLCSINPANDMADNPYFKKPPVKHHSALPQAAVPDLVAKLKVRGGKQLLELSTIAGLLMALYTGLRDTAIRAAHWHEIDLERRLWVVPSVRMKSKREHVVPLPLQAIEILSELHQLTYRGPESYVFASKAKQGFLSENTLRMGLHRLGFKVTAHGLRSLMTDVLNENNFNYDWIEKQLDHQERNHVRAAYLRTKFLEQRITMIQWYADWCDKPGTTSNVISFKSKAGSDP